MEQKPLLVVDDDPGVSTLLAHLLVREGFRVVVAGDAAQMRRKLESERFALITLDVNLPDEDGFALVREIRARWDTPIVMISANADHIDRIIGLELGADDYIVKPFNLREVLARIRAVLRVYEQRPELRTPEPDADYLFADRRLNVQEHILFDDRGEPVDLTSAEFSLLRLFLDHPRRVLTRDTIIDLLKGPDWASLDRSIDTLVSRLRRKIEANHDEPLLIKTIRGVGYVLGCEVTRADRD